MRLMDELSNLLSARRGASASPTELEMGWRSKVGRAGSVLQSLKTEDRAGPPYLVKVKRAFTLLEVVLALAVFAIIVVPAIGLVAISYRNTDTSQQAPNAVEIKSLLELELRGATGVYLSTFLSSDVIFYASQDLDEIERDGTSMADADKYYKVTVTEPEGYLYDEDDPNRVFLFNIIWPAYLPDTGVYNETNLETLDQLIIPVVLSK